MTIYLSFPFFRHDKKGKTLFWPTSGEDSRIVRVALFLILDLFDSYLNIELSSKNLENRNNFDIFICYYEDAAKDFATMIHRALTQRGYKVFVAHIERPYMTGDFRTVIDSAIDNCHTFVLLNTIGALEREEVKREVMQAFPNGVIAKHDFWIFREDESDVPRSTPEFETATKIDLSSQNQSDFSNDSHLARSALRKCNKKRESSIAATTVTPEKTTELSHIEYSELSMISYFAEQMKKKGFTVEIEKDIGNNLQTVLILQKDDRIILCEFKKSAESVKVGSLGTILLYKSELEHITPKNKIELWLIAKGIFNSTIHELAKKSNIQLIDDSNLELFIGNESIYLTTDRSVVVHGGTLRIFARVDRVGLGKMGLKILDAYGKVIYSKNLNVNDSNWITETIITKGPEWRIPNAEYSIIIEYGGRTEKTKVWRTHFGATVELDQKVYTWTDKVYITVVAPDWNLDPNIVDEITVSISTREYSLPKYKLVETGPNTGIFTGYVVLTGNPDIKGHEGVDGNGLKPTGKCSGFGPIDGFLRSRESDGISISFEFVPGQKVTGSALIRWNIGEIKWLEASYPAKGEAVLQIIDPDMNLDPNSIDKFETNVWSDSDPTGIKITMEETGRSTGIFQGKVQFTTEFPPSGNRLSVREGDSITGEYKDRTLPAPYTILNQLRLTATTFIGTIVPPLERVVMNNPIVSDEQNNSLDKVVVNQVIRIGANLSNNQNKDQPFAFLMSILDKHNVTVNTSFMSGTLSAWQSFKPFLSWQAAEPGTYIVQLFVWQSVNNPNALSAPLQFKIEVFGKTPSSDS